MYSLIDSLVCLHRWARGGSIEVTTTELRRSYSHLAGDCCTPACASFSMEGTISDKTIENWYS